MKLNGKCRIRTCHMRSPDKSGKHYWKGPRKAGTQNCLRGGNHHALVGFRLYPPTADKPSFGAFRRADI